MRTHPRLFSTLALLAMSAAVLFAPARTGLALQPPAEHPAAPSASQHITPTPADQLADRVKEYRQHIMTLSNPFFEGRAPGTDGNRRAADYIEFYLRLAGLTPAFAGEPASHGAAAPEHASFRQPFTAPATGRPDEVSVEAQNASYEAGSGTVTLKPGEDVVVTGYTANAEARGPLAFVGYSVKKGPDGYATYANDADVKGKIALLLRFEPMNESGKSKWVEERWSPQAGLDRKIAAAVDAGATGIIIVNPPGADDARVNTLEGLALRGQVQKIPVVQMSIPAADALVKAADAKGRSLSDLRRLADDLKPGEPGVVDLPGVTVSLKAALKRIPNLTCNLGAILPGRGDLADQFIVIGSHYDHVGFGYLGASAENRGKIHPGADDNASGSCANILAMEMLKAEYEKLPANASARSVLFLWFSAEESGLNGSQWYVQHPIVPLDKIYLMLNMDMVGRMREVLEVGGVGTAGGLADWTQPYWDAWGKKVKPTRLGAPNSDHWSFHTRKVPNLFFFTGLHREYHKPSDVASLINVEGAVDVTDLVVRVALDAAQRTEPMPFASDAKDEEQANDPGPVGGVGVRFGIAPGDYSGTEPGVLIGDVMPGLPAEKAGLKVGDLMVKWDDTPLSSVESWMPMLSKAKPGDKVKIVFIRTVDGKPTQMTTEATLVARQRTGQ